MDKITFQSLAESHFSLLLKWLMTPHVKQWWDKNIKWTDQLIKSKYLDYINGKKSIYGFIIYINNIPIGYIQYYNLHDFPREQNYKISDFPNNCAAIDYYIGEPDFIGNNIGSQVLELFIQQHVLMYFDNVLVDPDTTNIAAIGSYKNAGFKEISKIDNITIMVKHKLKQTLY